MQYVLPIQAFVLRLWNSEITFQPSIIVQISPHLLYTYGILVPIRLNAVERNVGFYEYIDIIEYKTINLKVFMVYTEYLYCR